MSFEVEFDLSSQTKIKTETRGWPWNRYKRITVVDVETGVQHVVDTRYGAEVIWTKK
jgi:hypothetical protein